VTALSADDTDWALAVAGEGEAFGRIFDRHRDRVFRHCVRWAESASDVDDIVAMTFFEAWRRRERVRIVDGSVLPWLLVTATNVARNQQRGRRRYRDLLERLPVEASRSDPADLVDDRLAHASLAALPARERQVIVLRLVDGLSERETAEALGISIGTVKSRLSRGRMRLRVVLEGVAIDSRGVANEA
jgi:RNA polymerase sigma factor (sigma-70 family)